MEGITINGVSKIFGRSRIREHPVVLSECLLPRCLGS